MAFTHSIRQITSYITGGKETKDLTTTDSQTAGLEHNISESITDGADQLVAYTLDISQCKTFAIWCEGGNMTVETNNGTTPDDTFSLTDGVPVIWSTGLPGSPTIPLTADITALYVTNTGTATLQIRALADPTV